MTSEWFLLRYWGGGTGPWQTYRPDKTYKCSSEPRHTLSATFSTFDEALGIAREHVAERPDKRYPVAVFSSFNTLTPLVIIEGEHVCRGYERVLRNSHQDVVVVV